MFKLNVEMNKMSLSDYICVILMFDMLNFVILISVLLFNLRIISKLNVSDLENFEFCIQIKIIKSSHKSINRE